MENDLDTTAGIERSIQSLADAMEIPKEMEGAPRVVKLEAWYGEGRPEGWIAKLTIDTRQWGMREPYTGTDGVTRERWMRFPNPNEALRSLERSMRAELRAKLETIAKAVGPEMLREASR
jgi:hypothetical protein